MVQRDLRRATECRSRAGDFIAENRARSAGSVPGPGIVTDSATSLLGDGPGSARPGLAPPRAWPVYSPGEASLSGRTEFSPGLKGRTGRVDRSARENRKPLIESNFRRRMRLACNHAQGPAECASRRMRGQILPAATRQCVGGWLANCTRASRTRTTCSGPAVR